MPQRVPNPHAGRAGAISVPNQPEALALFARMTVQPSARRKQLINQLIAALIKAGSWSSIVSLIDPSMETAQAAPLNWTGNIANDAQPTSVVHEPNKGWSNWNTATATFPLAATSISIGFIMGGVFNNNGNPGDPGVLTGYLPNGSQSGTPWMTGDGGIAMQGVGVASNANPPSPGVFGRNGNGVYFPYGYDVSNAFTGAACASLRLQRGGKRAITFLGILLVFQGTLAPAAMRASMIAVSQYLEAVGALDV